jgi:histidyl-tRNA synthetase
MIKAVRGTRDLLPPDTALWNFVEAAARDVFRAYNFQEIRTPIFEATELFARGVGEETDIVSKEMFTWKDGERFNEKKLIAEWLERNRSDDRTHVQVGRVNVETFSPIQATLNGLGIQLHVLRGLAIPSSSAVSSPSEFVAFKDRVTGDAIGALQKARDIAKKEYSNAFGNQTIHLRLVVPAEVGTSSTWIDTQEVEVEPFPGNFFSSSQSLTLRPENTAGVVRAYIEHNLWQQGLNKLYYIGPQFRRERPQKGRYRQFYQIGAEVIGPPTSGSERPLRDAELLEMLDTLLRRLGIKNFTLNLNSVGDPQDRTVYNAALRRALQPVVSNMCSDCQRRAVTNPLRVFDCKVPEDQPTIQKLPLISDFLGTESKEHFSNVQALLRKAGVEFKVNPHLVRGLDYYTRTAFEFTHDALGAQNAILGGGRYDGLAELLGSSQPAPGIGFAIGEDRLVMALQEQTPQVGPTPDVYVAPVGEGMNREALKLASELRREGIALELGDRSFRLKKMFDLAEEGGAKYLLIVGENEVKANAFTLKNLETKEQVSVPRGELAEKIRAS